MHRKDADRGVPAQLAEPALVRGTLLGVLAVESDRFGAFDHDDEHLLAVLAHLVASAIELDRVAGPAPVGGVPLDEMPRPLPKTRRAPVQVRFFAADGSTFVNGDYLIKGVAGRLLWRILTDYDEHGRTEFTNREIRLDASLELPAYRDNLESRLVLLQRRLEERQTPMRIHKIGRGRVRLALDGSIRRERIEES